MKPILCFFVSLFLILVFGLSCTHNRNAKISQSDSKAVVDSKFAKLYPDFNPQAFTDFFKVQVQEQGDSILSVYYLRNTYTPIWINDTLNTARIASLISILDSVHEHGLLPEYFNKSQIVALVDSIDEGLFSANQNLLYSRITALELLATKTVLQYNTGMSYGFVNPKKLFPGMYDIQLAMPDSVYYHQVFKEMDNDPISLLISSAPKDRVYQKMLAMYRDLDRKKEIEFDKIETKGTDGNYRLGERNKNIQAIANRLLITGEYVLSTTNDSVYQELDEQLLAAVNTFRERNSYPKDKEIGSTTIQALNRPLSYYKERIGANMERYRWRRVKGRSEKHIEVNVATFKLLATQKDSLPLTMRVCVGTVANKTPLLQSDINYINLNPFWTVPTSIARAEVSVGQKKDPNYIAHRNMKLFKGGKEVDPASIDWDKVDTQKFGYTVRQDAGNGNSLGRLKFMFDNSFSVYLHDTPTKSAFNRMNRAVSHGCVRVQQPLDLAAFCTTPSTDIYQDQLRYTVDQPPVSVAGKDLLKDKKLKKIGNIINLKNKPSLFIDYYTAYMESDKEELYYADDVYSYDAIILDALAVPIPVKKKNVEAILKSKPKL